MTTQQKKNETKKKEEEKPKLPIPKPALVMTGRGFEPKDMDQAWRFACALAESSIVPSRYAGKPGDCLIALDLSMRLRTSYLAVMQHVYSVKGRPAMEAVLSTALTNQSGLFVDPLEYEVEGKSVEDDNYRVRATAKRKSTGTVLYGPWISWKLVKAEGWFNKDGSKWKTMPEQMFHYRAASWFERRHCPEVSMGMLSPDEAESIPERKPVESITFDEAEQQAQEKIKSEQGSEPVKAEFIGDEGEKLCDFVCPECGRTYRYGAKVGIGVKCECGKAGIIRVKKPTTKTKKKKAAKKKSDDYLWRCLNKRCELFGTGFNEPKTSGTGENEARICPKCLTTDIIEADAPKDEKPPFMNDN